MAASRTASSCLPPWRPQAAAEHRPQRQGHRSSGDERPRHATSCDPAASRDPRRTLGSIAAKPGASQEAKMSTVTNPTSSPEWMDRKRRWKLSAGSRSKRDTCLAPFAWLHALQWPLVGYPGQSHPPAAPRRRAHRARTSGADDRRRLSWPRRVHPATSRFGQQCGSQHATCPVAVCRLAPSGH